MEITAAVLEALYSFGRMMPRPLEGPYVWANRIKSIDRPQYNRAIRHLKKRGLIKVITKKDRKFIKLTGAGQLEALLAMALNPAQQKPDGKWRLIIFDIPESSKGKRQFFRQLLKSNGFYKLQASVYVSPYPLNREALAYLKQTGLIGYIRILRVDEIDDDKDLINYFKIKLG